MLVQSNSQDTAYVQNIQLLCLLKPFTVLRYLKYLSVLNQYALWQHLGLDIRVKRNRMYIKPSSDWFIYSWLLSTADFNVHVEWFVSTLVMIAPQTKEGGFTQRESTPFCTRTAAVSRRHSADGAVSSGSALGRDPTSSDCFHQYQRQLSDGAVTAAGCLQQGSSSFSCLREVCGSGICSLKRRGSAISRALKT